MTINEFKDQCFKLTEEINELKAAKAKLLKDMAEQHPINNLKGKLVKVGNRSKPMFFDHIVIEHNSADWFWITIYGWLPKNDGTPSKRPTTGFVELRNLENEVKVVENA